jgi:hypothetical protein
MTIPKSVKIGDKRYTVLVGETSSNYTLGEIFYTNQTINVYTKTKMRKIPKSEQQVVFWHEVVHGILEEIKPKLNNDEQFVQAFAEHLVGVFKSARF